MIRAVKIKVSTQEVLYVGKYPRIDMQPVVGLDADLEWLIKYEPSPRPDVDGRIYDIVKNESITTTPHPDYPHLNQYLISYSTVKKIDDELDEAVVAAELDANKTIFTEQQQLKYITLGLGVLIHYMEGNTATAKMIVIKNKIKAMALRIWNNDTEMRNKIQEIIDGTTPDLDANWDKD